jgi:hypothetical protein
MHACGLALVERDYSAYVIKLRVFDPVFSEWDG